jgi:hypothetical protein
MIKKMYIGLYVKNSFYFLSDFNETSDFSTYFFSKNTQISNLISSSGTLVVPGG